MKILIPLDGSRTGESALPYIENLTSKLSSEEKVEVILLHVLPGRPYGVPSVDDTEWYSSTSYTEKEIEENRIKAGKYLDKAGETLKNKGVTVTPKVVVGADDSEEIVKAAEGSNVDFIAISTHGRTGISRWALGSVAEKVIRREGKIPILIVRAPHHMLKHT